MADFSVAVIGASQDRRKYENHETQALEGLHTIVGAGQLAIKCLLGDIAPQIEWVQSVRESVVEHRQTRNLVRNPLLLTVQVRQPQASISKIENVIVEDLRSAIRVGLAEFAQASRKSIANLGHRIPPARYLIQIFFFPDTQCCDSIDGDKLLLQLITFRVEWCAKLCRNFVQAFFSLVERCLGKFKNVREIETLTHVAKKYRERSSKSQAILELRRFRVLDPACGSGNFLYVAFREMKRLERELLVRLRDKGEKPDRLVSAIALSQFFGIDVVPFAVELARVTLMLAKELELAEAKKTEAADGLLVFEKPLPLDNLEKQIICADALFTDWPKADAIIGNPPSLGSYFLAQGRLCCASMVPAPFPEAARIGDFSDSWQSRELPLHSHS